MKYLIYLSAFFSFIFTQQVTSYSWEDGSGTILGSYGGLSNPANVGSTAGITPYDGSRMLTVSESPIDGTPQAFIAWVTDLSAGQDIEACFYGYDDTPSSSPSLRIWGSWSANDDITSYGGSADGNNDYTDGSGWGQVCHTFSTNQENWNDNEALIIQARLYSSSSGPDPTVYYIDKVEITAPNSATVNYPGGASGGCMNTSACNYDPYATEDDGSCILPQGSISIEDIQYTSTQGEYCYESPYDQQCWTTSGIVTAKNPTYPNFYIQESTNAYSGIYVHGYSATPPTLGDEITITATVNEFYSLTQLIDAASYSVNSSGNSFTPVNINTGDLLGCSESGEAVESMLVKINNVIVTTPSNEFGEWYVDDGSGPVMINDKLFDGEWLEPSTSQEFASVIGVVDYAYSEFSILPRTTSDIALCPTCPVASAGENQSVAPGDLVTLDASGSYDPDGSIIAYEWTQIGGSAVNLSDEESISTTFYAPNNSGDLIFRLSVYDNDSNEANDEITISVSPCTAISEVQFTTEQGTYCYESTTVGEEVNLCPAIVTAVTAGDNPNFFLSNSILEPWNGIFVFDNSINPQVGDEINLSGTVNEYYSFTQIIDVSSFSILSSNNDIIPLSIETGDLGIACSQEGESYEGMLIRLNDVTVEGIDEFGNIQINDGSGATLMDDYYFNGSWPNISVGDNISSIVGNVGYSYSEFKVYPRNEDDFGSCAAIGDLNGDGGFNVLDIVALANCILGNNCSDLDNGCAGDLNGDGGYNVLDIVALANCILNNNCAGRVNDATTSKLIISDKLVSIEADGFIGGVQMTINHDDNFSIEMTNRALFADFITKNNQTRLLVVNPETENLFNYVGVFEIIDIMVANTQYEVSVELPLVNSFSISKAYPNPFNPLTSIILNLSKSNNINIGIYNLNGQLIHTLLDGYKSAGIYKLEWNAINEPSGVYFIRAKSNNTNQIQKIMLMK